MLGVMWGGRSTAAGGRRMPASSWPYKFLGAHFGRIETGIGAHFSRIGTQHDFGLLVFRREEGVSQIFGTSRCFMGSIRVKVFLYV